MIILLTAFMTIIGMYLFAAGIWIGIDRIKEKEEHLEKEERPEINIPSGTPVIPIPVDPEFIRAGQKYMEILLTEDEK